MAEPDDKGTQLLWELRTDEEIERDCERDQRAEKWRAEYDFPDEWFHGPGPLNQTLDGYFGVLAESQGPSFGGRYPIRLAVSQLGETLLLQYRVDGLWETYRRGTARQLVEYMLYEDELLAVIDGIPESQIEVLELVRLGKLGPKSKG